MQPVAFGASCSTAILTALDSRASVWPLFEKPLSVSDMHTNDHEARGDGPLLHELADGNPEALERLYDRHAGALYALALRIAVHPEKAERAVEAAFSDLWQLRRSLVASGTAVPPALWLMTRCRARALEATSGARDVESMRTPRVAESRVAALLATDPESRSERVRQALAALPEPQRTVVERAYFEGATVARIAGDQARAASDVARDLRQGLTAIAASFASAPREGSAP